MVLKRLKPEEGELDKFFRDGELFNPEKDVIPLENLIENATVVLFDSKNEDYYRDGDYTEVIDKVVSFLEQF